MRSGAASAHPSRPPRAVRALHWSQASWGPPVEPSLATLRPKLASKSRFWGQKEPVSRGPGARPGRSGRLRVRGHPGQYASRRPTTLARHAYYARCPSSGRGPYYPASLVVAGPTVRFQPSNDLTTTAPSRSPPPPRPERAPGPAWPSRSAVSPGHVRSSATSDGGRVTTSASRASRDGLNAKIVIDRCPVLAHFEGATASLRAPRRTLSGPPATTHSGVARGTEGNGCA